MEEDEGDERASRGALHADEETPGAGGEEEEEEAWGDSFAVQWLCTDRLSFHRTRHLRNPWNHDKEVKVSRDGTELEPSVGQQLLEEFQKLAVESQVAHPMPSSTTGAGRPPSGRRVASTR